MIHLSNTETQDLIQTIENTHWYFVATRINPELVPKRVMKDLIKMGFKKTQILRYPELALHFGFLSVYLKDKDASKITFEQLKKIVRAKKFLPLSIEEKFALKNIEERAMSDIKGLGNKISKITHSILIEADAKQRKNYERIIKDVTYSAIKKREGIKYIAREIAERTGDWTRDLDRIGDYLLHDSFDNGRILAIKKQRGGDAKVWKSVHPQACESCKKLYLKNQKTWEPKIFTVDELISNGSNVGRKKENWLPVVGPIHPWCRCTINYLSPGFVWSAKSQRFIPDNSIRGKNLFTSKIKVIVNKS